MSKARFSINREQLKSLLAGKSIEVAAVDRIHNVMVSAEVVSAEVILDDIGLDLIAADVNEARRQMQPREEDLKAFESRLYDAYKDQKYRKRQ